VYEDQRKQKRLSDEGVNPWIGGEERKEVFDKHQNTNTFENGTYAGSQRADSRKPGLRGSGKEF